MLVLYTVNSCPAGRRIKQYLKDRLFSYEERNLYRTLLDPTALQEMIRRSCDPLPGSDRDEEEMMALLKENPSLIMKPVFLSDEEDRELVERLKELRTAHCNEKCPKWSLCGKVRSREEVL